MKLLHLLFYFLSDLFRVHNLYEQLLREHLTHTLLVDSDYFILTAAFIFFAFEDFVHT